MATIFVYPINRLQSAIGLVPTLMLQTSLKTELVRWPLCNSFHKEKSLCDCVIFSTKSTSPWSMTCSLTWLWQISLKYTIKAWVARKTHLVGICDLWSIHLLWIAFKSYADWGRDLSEPSKMISFFARCVRPSATLSMVVNKKCGVSLLVHLDSSLSYVILWHLPYDSRFLQQGKVKKGAIMFM